MSDKLGKIDLGSVSEDTGLDRGAELYDIWKAKIKVRNKLYGGVPKSPSIISDWHKQRIKEALKAGHNITPERSEKDLEEIMKTVDVDEEATWNGFKEYYKGEHVGPYLDGYNLKACIREGATQTGVTLMRWSNNRGFRQHYQHGVHVKSGDGKSDIILLGPVAGQDEFVGHIRGPQGPKSIINRFDYVASGLELEFQVWSLAVGIIDDDLIKVILLASQEIGLGAARSRELSKFDLVSLERIHIGSIPHMEKMKVKAQKEADKKNKK